MKIVANVLFFAGFAIAGIGICFIKANVLLAVKMMFSGFVGVSISCLLDEWFVEVSEYEF